MRNQRSEWLLGRVLYGRRRERVGWWRKRQLKRAKCVNNGCGRPRAGMEGGELDCWGNIHIGEMTGTQRGRLDWIGKYRLRC